MTDESIPESRVARALLYAVLGAISMGIGILGIATGELSVSEEWSIETFHVGTVRGASAAVLSITFISSGALYGRAFLRNWGGHARSGIPSATLASIVFAVALAILILLAYQASGT